MESTRSLTRFHLPENLLSGVLTLLISAGCVALVLLKPGGITATLGDFRAFYCAGSVAAQQLDPYAAAPLETCEAKLGLRSLFSGSAARVLPAPLPGYLVAFFKIFALMPFGIAAIVWTLLLVAAVSFAIVLLAGTGWMRADVFLAASSISVICVSVIPGELVPVALLGIALAAWGVARDRLPAVAFGVLLTMAEPQVGLVLGLALSVMRARYALVTLVAFASLGAASLLALGFEQNVRYIAVVLPEHVRAELPAGFQYSLSWIGLRSGMSDGAALALGHASYVVMALAAVTVAWFMRERTNRVVAVLAAPALAVCGGPFLHLDHIALAIPASLALVAAGNPALRNAQTAASICLALPLAYIFANVELLIALPLVAGWIYFGLGGTVVMSVRVAAAATLYALFFAIISAHVGMDAHEAAAHLALPSGLASTPWADYVRAHAPTSWLAWAVKLTTWFSLAATAVSAVALALQRKRERAT
jgi:Glycosyltransferase family 87